MSMRIQDRVRFTLHPTYYSQGSSKRKWMQKILQQAFDISACKSNDLFERNPCGLTIVCRPSQFGRFIVLRNVAGIPNGIKHLDATLFQVRDAEQYDASNSPHQLCYVDYPVKPNHSDKYQKEEEN